MQKQSRSILILALLIAIVAAILFWWKPWSAPGTFVSVDELGYLIEYQIDPETQHVHQSNPDRDGKEYVGVIVQGKYSTMILDGELTYSREPRGTVKKGDRIKVAFDGRVWVNGEARSP